MTTPTKSQVFAAAQKRWGKQVAALCRVRSPGFGPYRVYSRRLRILAEAPSLAELLALIEPEKAVA